MARAGPFVRARAHWRWGIRRRRDILLKLLSLVLFTALSTAALPLFAQDKLKPGANASTEGGVSLGGTGIGPAAPNPRAAEEEDKRLRIVKKPKPEEAS